MAARMSLAARITISLLLVLFALAVAAATMWLVVYGSNDFDGADDAVYRWEGVVWLSVAAGLVLIALLLLAYKRRARRWLVASALCAAALVAEGVQAARLAFLTNVGNGSVGFHFHGMLNGLWVLGGLAGLTALACGAARWRANRASGKRRLPE